MNGPARRLAWTGFVLAAILLPGRPAAIQKTSDFAARVAALSEPGGYFDTDNLISNERSFLHVAPALRALARGSTAGGVYLGVGPDQNFSYIAHTRPSLAILIDIRRDNLLLHLLFKAIFAEAPSRVHYLALLTGREPPAAGDNWSARPIDALVAYIDRAPRLSAARASALRSRLAEVVRGFGMPMTAADRATIDRFHQRFIDEGLGLQFNSTGRAPQYDYPAYRDLLLEVDRQGVRQGFLAAESDFQFVKDLQARDQVIPIVGNLAGPSALAAVAKFLTMSNQKVSAFYTSNVEFYLFRDGSFPAFVSNLGRLPRAPGSVIIRSVFASGGGAAVRVPGYNSASLTQPIEALVNGYAQGQFRQYSELTRQERSPRSLTARAMASSNALASNGFRRNDRAPSRIASISRSGSWAPLIAITGIIQ